jgi:polar amino acid transport system substrate-binding protein
MSEMDLSGAVIAAQTGTIQAAHVASSGATLVEFATPEETVAAVRAGEADAVLADGDFLMPIADEDPDLMIVGDPVPLGGGIGMGVRESDGELKARFDAAIDSMKADGTLDQMIVKWFGDEAITWAMVEEGGK